MRPAELLSRSWVFLLLAAFLVSLGSVGLLDPGRLARGAVNIGIFVGALLPPEMGVLPTVAGAMVETVQMAFAGTLLGLAFALPLALAASPVLFGPMVASVARLALGMVRTIPSLLWAIVFVVAIGLGPAAGALGIALYSLGYMGKLFYEMFEAIDPDVLEAVRSVGSTRLQLARYALLPEAANHVLAQVVFMFEYNVRASAIMGFVGAGGIGFYLLGYIQMLQYRNLMTALLVTFVVVILIDQISAAIRRRFVAPVSIGAPV